MPDLVEVSDSSSEISFDYSAIEDIYMDDPPAEQPRPACDIFGNSDSELSTDEGDLKVAGLDCIPIQESD